MRPLKPCRQVGCPNLVRPPERYCDKHRWTDAQRDEYDRERNRERYKRYDTEKRDRRSKAFYNSAEWQRVRQHVLARDNHLCVMCLESHRMTPAEHVDHIVPIRDDWSRRLDPTNCRSLCHPCHTRRHATERDGQLDAMGARIPPGV